MKKKKKKPEPDSLIIGIEYMINIQKRWII